MNAQMTDLASTVRFLQEENLRLSQTNQDLHEENAFLREAMKSIRTLQRVVSRMDTTVALKPLLDRIMYEALRIVDAEDGSLTLIDEEKQETVFVVVRGALQEKLQGFRLPVGEGIVGWVIANGKPVIADDISQDERFSPAVDQTFQFHTRSLICAPLISRGKVLGAIEAVNKFSAATFQERDLDMLAVAALIAATAIDLANTEPLPSDSAAET